jgi:hypothetical protein
MPSPSEWEIKLARWVKPARSWPITAAGALLDRLPDETGQAEARTACVNVAPEAVQHPSPRVANGFMRRGYRVYETRPLGRTRPIDGAGHP